MIAMKASLFLALLTSTLSDALIIKGKVADDLLPLSVKDITSTVLYLTSDAPVVSQAAYLKDDGEFSFELMDSMVSVNGSTYRIHPESSTLSFKGDIKVEITEQTGLTVTEARYGHLFADKGPSMEYPIELRGSRRQFFAVRESFSLMKMMMNPMMLMSLFALVMVVGFPKLLENIDPEELQKYQDAQSQKQSTKAVEAIQEFDMAAYLARKAQKEADEEAQKTKEKEAREARRRKQYSS